MKFPEWLQVYGNTEFRGKCPKEDLEQITFFNAIRRDYPDYGRIAIHPKNEAKRKGKEFRVLQKDKAMGLTKGASDIIIPGSPAFVCEMKRQDHTQCAWQTGQLEYLEACSNSGAFVCVALGHDGALRAVEEWMGLVNELRTR